MARGYFLWGNFILIEISLKFVPFELIDIKSALIQVMAQCKISGKSLTESKMTQFTDEYMHH